MNCNRTLPIDRFRLFVSQSNTGSKKSYRRRRCDECEDLTARKCPDCGKLVTGYKKGRSGKCKPCSLKKDGGREWRPDGKYHCAKCDQMLPASEFWLDSKEGVKRVHSYCKPCGRKRNKEAARARRSGAELPEVKEKRCGKENASYDYQFARTFFGWSHEKAAAWVEQGYDGIGLPDNIEESQPT
jgi:hypothetical protein